MHSVALGLRFGTPLRNPVRTKAFTLAQLFYSSSSYHCPPSSLKLLGLLSDVHPRTRMENFWTGGSVDKNKKMVESLQRYGIIKSKKVAEVMEKIDRGLFVQSDTPAYVDSPMQIGYNATISAPHMHATCLELLKQHLQPGMRALDVGSGTGYLTACFAFMVGPQGRAVGVEHIPELVAFSIVNIKKSSASSLLEEGSLSVHVSGFFTVLSGMLPHNKYVWEGGRLAEVGVLFGDQENSISCRAATGHPNRVLNRSMLRCWMDLSAVHVVFLRWKAWLARAGTL